MFCTRGGCLNYHKLTSSEQEYIIYTEKQKNKTKHNIESQEHLFSFILGPEEGTVAVVGSTVLSVFSAAPREASICPVGVMMSKTLQGQNCS